MNKNEFLNLLATKSGKPKNVCSDVLDAFFECVQETLKSGDDIRFVGFGTFYVTKRAASEGRNPRTGAPLKIAASNQPKFKAGKGLKDSVN